MLKKQKDVVALERKVVEQVKELDLLKALQNYIAKGKPLPALVGVPKATAGRRGRKPGVGRGRGRRGAKRPNLSVLLPEILKGFKEPINVNTIIDEAAKMGWRSSSQKPYLVVYNAAKNLVKKGVLKKKDSKFTVA